MLSVENSPPDPPCNSQLNTNITSHDSPSPKLPLAEVDLVNPSSSSLHHLPNFCIRDYVLSSRRKDVKKNWPFSLKHLQLCLKHGVKDVLPPFQSPRAVKTRSSRVDNNSTCNFHEEPSSSLPNTDDQVLESSSDARLKRKHEDVCIATTSCRSGGEHNLPSTSVSQSEIESVPTKRLSSSTSLLETDNFPEASVSASASASATIETATHPIRSSKSENTNRILGKKCRLIVKFGGNSDRSSAEDIVSNSTAVSETMASKVCPVCKIFTSSSNTTLNAHIDQCLFAESTPKWTADSKLTRHRIKPRKTRLMVDIYTTAKHCTLEELDRRNGTNWATVSSLPNQNTEMVEIPGERGKRQRISQVHPEDAGEVGEVYIDSSGTKLRILSKANDAPPAASKVVDDPRPRNPSKGGKGSKFLSTKRKKCHSRKHLKYLRLASQSRKLFSQKTRISQISGGEDGCDEVEKTDKTEGHQIQKQIKSSDSGTLRQWACSKRTGLAKKVNDRDGRQPSKCKWHLSNDLLVETGQSSFGASLKERNRVQKYANLSENLIFSPETTKRLDKPFQKAQVGDNLGRSSLSLKPKGKQLSGHALEPSNSSRKNQSSLHSEAVGLHGSPVNNSDGAPSASPQASAGTHALGSKSLILLSRKKVSSVSNRTTIVKSKPTADEACLARKKTEVNIVGEVNEEVVTWRSKVDQQYAFTSNNDSENFETEGQEAMTMQNSLRESQRHDHEGDNTDSSTRASDDFLDKVDVLESIDGTVTNMGNSVDSNLLKLSNRSETQSNSNSLHSIDDYNGILYGPEPQAGPGELRFFDGEEMYCHSEAGHGIIGQNASVGRQLDSDMDQVNSFPEVDPIQIPGPPGSFLPSPRHMGSDDFKGNSSLTTGRLQSSQDQLDLVDGDSSDSPISAVSTISNPNAARSDFKYSESSSSVGVQDKMNQDISTATIEILGKSASVPPRSTGAERLSDGEKFKVSKLTIEKRSLGFKNDTQPCCCQRKERISQDITPKYHESELLRRRKLASVTIPSMGKQISSTSDIAKPNDLDEIFSPNSCHSLGSEKVNVLPSVKSSSAASLSRGDCESVSPSTPNPVLRLMGKNLMVVNKEEDAPFPHRQSLPCSEIKHASGVSYGSMQHQEYRSTNMVPPHRPAIFSQNPYVAAEQSPDARFSNCYRNHGNPSSIRVPAQVTASMFPGQPTYDGFGPSVEPLMYDSSYSLRTRVVHDRPKIRRNEASYNVGNIITTPSRPQKNADSGASVKEIIIIDDVPESEVGKITDIPKANQLVSSSISIPVVPAYNVRHENPFSCPPLRDPSFLGQPPATHTRNLHAIPSNASPVRWGCTPEGAGVLHRSSFVASSTSTSGQSRSVLYYSPSLS